MINNLGNDTSFTFEFTEETSEQLKKQVDFYLDILLPSVNEREVKDEKINC